MTPEIPPTLEEWVELYCAAAVLKSIAPWRWMWDSEVFGVKDPETGVVGYCTVMGRLGEHLALGVCLGPAGLAGLEAVRRMKKADFVEFVSTQNMLKVSFESRADLEPDDLKVIKLLGFSFRGRQAWPLFRSYRPGYMPWFLTGAEARFLTVAIQQALFVAAGLVDEREALKSQRPGTYLVRVSVPGKDGPVWQDEWLEPLPLADEEAVAVLMAETQPEPALIEQACSKARVRGGTWEVDIRCLKASIGGRGERPYIPLQIIIADHESGFIFDTDLRPPDGYVTGFREHFVRVLDKLGQIPDRILFATPRTKAVLAPIASALGIPLERSRRLPEVERFHRSLTQSLERHGLRGL